MSKLTKLHNNPKLFFKDFFKNRKKELRIFNNYIKNMIQVKNTNLLDNDNGINQYRYKISIIIPAYNAGETLFKTLDSLLSQQGDIDMEVLVINDGSIDNTSNVVSLYTKLMPNIKLINKENGGVSSARNIGLKNAQGEYILFLDSDDTLTNNTLNSIIQFFDKNKDEIDLVTYPLFYVRNGIAKCDHFRYKDILIHSGIYDIDDNPFICQTTINICIKNNLGILFNESLLVQEDQDFNLNILNIKRKIGFVSEAGYYYYKDNNSLSSVKNNPLYSFEMFINYYEQLFLQSENDEYTQCLFLYNLQWRLKSDQLFPYYLYGKEYIFAINRLKVLVSKIDMQLIMNFPNLDFFHKFYLLKFSQFPIDTILSPEEIKIISGNNCLYSEKSIEIVINNIKVINGKLKLIGVLKSLVFSFLSEPPKLYFKFKNGYKKYIELNHASESFYKTKVKVADFYSFNTKIDINEVDINFKIYVEINNTSYSTRYYFNTFSAIYPRLKRNSFTYGNTKISFSNNTFFIENNTVEISDNDIPEVYKNVGFISDKIKIDNIWLYYDCKNVMIDNGLLQFIHDADKDDGVHRFFIWNNNINDIPDLVPKKLHCKFVKFGSNLHKSLILKTKKVITSFIEHENIYPFTLKEIPYFTDRLQFELIYLQHGILHASMPHKYTQEKLFFDKIVISTNFEKENFYSKYGVAYEDMIQSGMPRLGLVDKKNQPSNRILLAPSWRSYLINKIESDWEPDYNRFLNSKFFQQINGLLSSPELLFFLENNDLYLDLQLHPIFSKYKDCFNFNHQRINFAAKDIKIEEYRLFITDFSSWVFDFVYLERPVLYFVPDIDEFYAGLASYRELDLPFDKAFGPVVNTYNNCIIEIEKIYNNDFKVDKVFLERMQKLFIKIDNPEEEIYSILFSTISN